MPQKEQPPHPAEKTNRWMVTFADVITLLMCFFIFLVTYSTIETSSLEKVKSYLVSSIGVLDDGSVHERTVEDNDASLFPRHPETHDEGNRSKSGDKQLENRVDLLSKKWSAETEIDLSKLDENGVIQVERLMKFSPGSAKIPRKQRVFLDDVALVLRQESYLVVVQGHSDAHVDTHLADPDGFYLAGERAANVAAYLIEVGKITRDAITVESFGKHRPLVDGQDALERAVNRRVGFEITLARKKE